MSLAHKHNCTCCNQAKPVSINRAFQFDPTRTLTVRNRFSTDLTKRFRALKGAIRTSIVTRDGFGLKNQPRLVTFAAGDIRPAGFNQFAFPRSQDKVSAFMQWLREQENIGILEISEGQQIGEAVETAWTNQYIQSAYQKGILRGRTELVKAGYDVKPISKEFGGINAVFNQPFHVDRVGLAYTRTFTGLKGITDEMDKQISSVLAQGLAEGRNPIELARQINKKVDAIGITRAKTLARTEVIRAHHQATIQEYKNAEVAGVSVKAEFKTAGDSRVCVICQGLEGRVFTLKEAEGIIPVHPNCRCVFLPLDVTGLNPQEVKQLIKETEREGRRQAAVIEERRNERIARERAQRRARQRRRAS